MKNIIVPPKTLLKFFFYLGISISVLPGGSDGFYQPIFSPDGGSDGRVIQENSLKGGSDGYIENF